MGIDINKKHPLVELTDNNGNDISDLLKFNPKDSKKNEIPIIVNNGAALKYGLYVGQVLDLQVLNNTIQNSYNLINQFVPLTSDPINNDYKVIIKGINSDSIGEKFYMNQSIANRITGLDQVDVISRINPNKNLVQKIKPTFTPFNSVLSKSDKLLVGTSLIPFYSKTGIWNFQLNINQVKNLNTNITTKLMIGNHPEILKPVATALGIDPKTPNLVQQVQDAILAKYKTNPTFYIQSMKKVNGEDSITLALASTVPSSFIYQVFDVTTNLVTILVYILIAILIPLLVVVVLIVSFSMIEDLFERIALMKVVGMNGKEIVKILLMMYIPIVIGFALLGAGLMFGLTHGLQAIVYTITSVFITNSVSMGIFSMGFGVIIGIFALSILFMSIKLKKKEIANAVKF